MVFPCGICRKGAGGEYSRNARSVYTVRKKRTGSTHCKQMFYSSTHCKIFFTVTHTVNKYFTGTRTVREYFQVHTL